MDYSLLFKNMKILRQFNGLSAEACSFKLGFKHPKRFADLEANRGMRPHLMEVIKIASLFNVNMQDLLTRELELKFKIGFKDGEDLHKM